jgi:hypothetical protein
MMRITFVGMALAALAACSAPEEPVSEETLADDVSPNRGAEILMPFKKELKLALQSGMQQGPIEAIGACRTLAPGIAEKLSVDGVAVGRSSHRLRNPANAAPDWVAPILDAYVADPASRIPRTVDLADGRSGYVEPIMIMPMCLACHGETLAPEMQAKLAELYPGDQATGFKDGDLRGVFWAEYAQ